MQQYLRIPENKGKIYTVFVPGKGSVRTKPDLPLSLGGVTDIKNVKNISFTTQLKAQAALAKQEGTSFNLIISPNTRTVSKNLWDNIQWNNGKVFEFNPTTGKMIERIVKGNQVLR